MEIKIQNIPQLQEVNLGGYYYGQHLEGSRTVTERTMGKSHGQKRKLRQPCDLMSKMYSPKANVIMMSCNHTQQDYTIGTRKNVLGKGGDKG